MDIWPTESPLILARQMDVRVSFHGNMVQFHMLTKKAVEWMLESLAYESWQLLGAQVLLIDHRYAESVLEVVQEAGLAVKVES
jgi:hypothetical protein